MLKITVITVCYNDKDKLRITMDSVCGQTYPNIEYLIIDGGSTDGTEDVIDEYSQYANIHFYSEKDYGIYNAMNRGILRATGDYISFLNAGDLFYNLQVLSDVAVYIGEDRDSIYYGKACIVYPDGLKQIQDFTKNAMNLKEIMIDGNMPNHQSIFSPRKALVNHLFEEQYKIRADYEWLLYCVTNGYVCKTVPMVINYYDISGFSGRIKNIKLLKEETRIILEKYQQSFMGIETSEYRKTIGDKKNTEEKYAALFYLMNYWLMLKQNNHSVGEYLWEKEYRHIGIYGISHMGINLIKDLDSAGVKVDYAIDRNVDKLCMDIKIFSPDEGPEKVDAIVVTVLDCFNEIKEKLQEKVDCPIISLEDVIYEVGEERDTRKSN